MVPKQKNMALNFENAQRRNDEVRELLRWEGEWAKRYMF
jgi:hypothetical protein